MTRLWIALLLTVVACKSKPKPTTEPAGSAGSAAVGSATLDAGSAAPVADAAVAIDAVAAAASAEPGCDGWRVRKIEEMGLGASSVKVECAGDKVKLTTSLDSARGESESETKILPRAKWVTLWQQLEAAGWRTLDPACPTVNPPPESMGVTGLELTISDGKTTKQIKCEGLNVTGTHEQIMKALDDAAE